MDYTPRWQEPGGISDMLLSTHNSASARVRNRGFLLIEVMITFLLITIVLIALAKFQVVTLRDNNLANSRTVAVNFAQDKLESLRNFTDSVTYQAIDSGSDSIGPPGSSAVTILTGLNTVYTRSWSVSSGATPDDVSMEVIVMWPDEKGEENSSTKIMLISDISNISAVNSGKLY